MLRTRSPLSFPLGLSSLPAVEKRERESEKKEVERPAVLPLGPQHSPVLEGAGHQASTSSPRRPRSPRDLRESPEAQSAGGPSACCRGAWGLWLCYPDRLQIPVIWFCLHSPASLPAVSRGRPGILQSQQDRPPPHPLDAPGPESQADRQASRLLCILACPVL